MVRKIIKTKKSVEKINKKTSRIIIYIISFFVALSSAIPAYVNSSFIEKFANASMAGWFFVAANTMAFIAMLYFPKIIRKINNLMSVKIMMLIDLASLIVLMLSHNILLLFIAFVLMWVSSQLIFNNLDIFVESFTRDSSTGKIRAIFFTFMNLAWIVSPLVAAKLVVNDYYSLVYLVSAAFILLAYFIIVFNKKRIFKPIIYTKTNIRKTIASFWHNQSLKGVYFSSFFLNLFYNSAVVFIPIYLHNTIGFDWITLGIMFSIMLIPFVLFEIPAGIIADKYLGEKEVLNIGFIILIISLLLFFFVKSTNPLVWGAILFFSRIGAAFIESMREARFFKIVDAKDVSHINFLRTSNSLGYLIGSGLSVLLLYFYDIQYSFLFLAVLFLYSFYFVYIIKDSK